MSGSPQGSSAEDETVLLEYRCHPPRPEPPSPTPPRGEHSSVGATSLSAPGCAPQAEPHRVVLSTNSPAALKVGTQQLIPRSLAVSTKSKGSPSRHQSLGAAGPSQEPLGPDPQRVCAPSPPRDDEEEEEEDGGGALKRTLRNMSYRVAVKGSELEPASASPLPPLPEDGSALPARSPARSKRTFGRKRPQRRGGSFKDQPRLYQEIRERGLNSISHDSDEDLLEEPPPGEPSPPGAAIVMQSYRPAQVTWSQLPEVLEAGILQRISPEERKRQEAMFEIITSEFSYMHSLGVLVCHFMRSEELKETMTQTEHHHLFSNINDILTVSTNFFEALEKRHQEHLLLPDISDIVEEHASQRFGPYVSYCSNEVYQQRTLQRLLSTNPSFKETLKQIERKPECGGLPLISFLILPMQRTVCQKCTACSAAYGAATRALTAISKLVKSCNDGARAMERTEQLYSLQQQLHFGRKKPFPLVSASRWLLKRGQLQLLQAEEPGILRRAAGRPCHLLLFNDVLIITKRKSEDCYTVLSYATLDQVRVQKLESAEPPGPGKGGARGGPLLRVVLLKDSEGRREELLLAAQSLSDRARWLAALVHREKAKPDPVPRAALAQVEASRAYLARQADELSLQQADVVLVLGEEDGWCWGERLRDGEQGWFPQACARQITNPSAVEGNVRRMERLRRETHV